MGVSKNPPGYVTGRMLVGTHHMIISKQQNNGTAELCMPLAQHNTGYSTAKWGDKH